MNDWATRKHPHSTMSQSLMTMKRSWQSLESRNKQDNKTHPLSPSHATAQHGWVLHKISDCDCIKCTTAPGTYVLHTASVDIPQNQTPLKLVNLRAVNDDSGQPVERPDHLACREWFKMHFPRLSSPVTTYFWHNSNETETWDGGENPTAPARLSVSLSALGNLRWTRDRWWYF